MRPGSLDRALPGDIRTCCGPEKAHRSTGTLYLHILGATDDAAIEEAVRAVHEAEARVLRTFGSAAELAALQADRPQPDHDDVVREVS